MTYPTPDKMAHDRVAVDFDGVLAESTWPLPTIGEPIREGVELLLHYADLGHEVFIYTSRPASHAGAIWRWLVANGLDSVVYDVKTDKPLAGLYVDDRAFRFERSVPQVREIPDDETEVLG